MTAKTWSFLAVIILTAGLCFNGLLKRKHHHAAVLRDGNALLVAAKDWTRAGRPQGEDLQRILEGYGNYKPFVFTNAVTILGTNYDSGE